MRALSDDDVTSFKAPDCRHLAGVGGAAESRGMMEDACALVGGAVSRIVRYAAPSLACLVRRVAPLDAAVALDGTDRMRHTPTARTSPRSLQLAAAAAIVLGLGWQRVAAAGELPMCPNRARDVARAFMRCTADASVTDEGSALLYCPRTGGPHPLVAVAGSPSRQSKWEHASFARALVERGYAVAMLSAPPWDGGLSSEELRFAANVHAPHVRHVVRELLAAHAKGASTSDCELSGAVALLGTHMGSEAVVFAAAQQQEAGEPHASATILLSTPYVGGVVSRERVPASTTDEACRYAFGASCPRFAAPTLLFGTTWLAKPEARSRPSIMFGEEAFASEHAHIDALDDSTNATLSSEERSEPGCLPCRRPRWDGGETARALVATRIDAWLRAHLAGDPAMRAEIASWPRVSTVASIAVEPSAEYTRAFDADWAAGEERMNRPEVLPLVSAPLVLGGASRPGPNGGGFAVGLRPELVVGWIHDRLAEPRTGWGLGGYLDGTTITGRIAQETLFGGGGTVVGYTGDYGVALSVGADLPTSGNSALACIGAFVGFRGDHRLGPMDMPFGVRFDARLGPDSGRSYTVGAQLDIVALFVGVPELLHFLVWPHK